MNVSPHISWTKIEDKTIITNNVNKETYVLNKTGSIIFELILEYRNIDHVNSILIEMFGNDISSKIIKDVKKYTNEMISLGIISTINN